MFRHLPPQVRLILRGKRDLLTAISLSIVSLILYFRRVQFPTSVQHLVHFPTNTSRLTASQPVNLTKTPPRNSSPFEPGPIDPPDREYTKALVIARTKVEDISWLNDTIDGTEIPVSDGWQIYVYTTDDLTAEYHTPLNKGREAMAYLTYIIEHYNPPTTFTSPSSSPSLPDPSPQSRLPEITLFLHAHRQSWHDNLFSLTTPATISSLRLARVRRLGYMNLRCSWEPGCPDHIHPLPLVNTSSNPEIFDPSKPEESIFALAWSQIFPASTPVPSVLSQPCCAQFALSRERILSIPLAIYVGLRDWLITTNLPDALSGRVMEYLWQVLWTGETVLCPAESGCYCDGYGICFGGDVGFSKWMEKRVELWTARVKRDEMLGQEVEKWGEGVVMDLLGRVAGGEIEGVEEIDELVLKDDNGRDSTKLPTLAKVKEILLLGQEAKEIEEWLDRELADAKERGKDSDERQKEAGYSGHV